MTPSFALREDYMGSLSRSRSLQTLLLALSFLLPESDAQVLSGSVVGAVVDEAGSAVPGAKVRLTSTGTAQVRETETDESGNYSFPSLVGDTYDLAVTKSGFQTFSVRNVLV